MFLQLALLAFAVQWFGSPWQLGAGKAFLACLLFIVIVFLSALPALFREWGNIKSALKVYAIIQLVCLVFAVLIPGIGQILAIVFNIFLMTRPVSFYKYLGFGFILFFLWFIGLNNILGLFLIADPRGVLSGKLYITATTWVILGIFIGAIVRAVYHARTSYKIVFLSPKDTDDKNNSGIIESHLPQASQTLNVALLKKEKKTFIIFFFVSFIAVFVSLFIQPSIIDENFRAQIY